MARQARVAALVACVLTGCGCFSPSDAGAKARPKGVAGMDRFETDRLIIRRFVSKDWRDVQKLAIDKESSEAAAWDHRWPTGEEGCKGATDYLAKHSYWAVCLKDGGRVIGLVSFNEIDAEKHLDLGHLFHREFTTQDYDTEALRRIMDHAFTDLGVQEVHGDNAAEWTAQLAPLKKLGMTLLEPPPEQRGRKSFFRKRPDGTPIEFVGCRMQITREEWMRRKRGDKP